MSIQLNELQGAYTALITPMCSNGEIDHKILERLIDDQITSGIDGILACGTTGQSATLSYEEHIDLVEHIYNHINGRTQFMASAGSNSTREAIKLSNEIEDRIGPTTLLHVTGYYNNPPQQGLIAHYTAIADSLNPESNLILYNVPGRTGSNIEAKTAIVLSKNPKIIGIKEASGDLDQVDEVIRNTDSNNFRVISGEDDLVSEIMEKGGYGVISATANIAPRYFKQITQSALNGKYVKSHYLQNQVNPLVKAVFSAKNPIPLAHMFDTNLRLPLVRLPKINNQIEDTLRNYDPEKLGINTEDYGSRCRCF